MQPPRQVVRKTEEVGHALNAAKIILYEVE